MGGARFSKYGDITKVETSGASQETANQDRLDPPGRDASYKMALHDADRMEEYRDMINDVAKETEIHPALIAGIISRESRAGNTIKHTRGYGDHGKAFGLMQVDIHPDGGNHDPEGEWDSEEHLLQATWILVDFIKKIQRKFPNWSKEQQLKGGIAAYNMGDGNVHSYNRVDENTTGKDYSNDVVARAQWYEDIRSY